MGTLKKAVNLAKGLFSNQKEKKQYLTRKQRRSGVKKDIIPKYLIGGGRKGINSSDAVIFFPKHKKFKGYMRAS